MAAYEEPAATGCCYQAVLSAGTLHEKGTLQLLEGGGAAEPTQSYHIGCL